MGTQFLRKTRNIFSSMHTFHCEQNPVEIVQTTDSRYKCEGSSDYTAVEGRKLGRNHTYVEDSRDYIPEEGIYICRRYQGIPGDYTPWNILIY